MSDFLFWGRYFRIVIVIVVELILFQIIMDILFLIGRILFGGFFLLQAYNHFTKTQALSQYAASKKVPSPRLAVQVSGALLIVGGAGIILGAWIQWAVLSLVLFLVPVSFAMHPFWGDQDQHMKSADMVNFLKNMALLGAALVLLSVPQPWMYSM